MKCGQCERKSVAKIKVGDREVRHLCGRHFQLYKNKEDKNNILFVRASDIDM